MICKVVSFLADVPTPADRSSWMVVGVVLGALFVLTVCANQIDDFLERRRGKLNPPNEQLKSSHDDLDRRVSKIEDRLIGQEWFDKVDADLTEIKAELKKDRDDNERHVSMRASKIYETMESNTQTLRKEMHDQSAVRELQITELRRTIEDLPERVLNMLEKIKALAK